MTPIIPLDETIAALRQLYPPPLDIIFLANFDYQPKHTFVLDRTLFAQTLTTIPRLF
jgi:hypothetical protein